MILFVIFTAKILSMTLIYFRVPAAIVAWVNSHEMTFTHIFLAVVLIYLLLGMFIEGIAMMVLTVPFIMPVMEIANMDPVWMGVVICIMIEVGLLSPPVGLNLFVLQGVTKEPIRQVIVGTLPFLVLQLLMVAILYFWPDIALYLPGAVMGG
jgi:TRAP-type C4-dicarboxylate transport system permease large subunit